MQFCGVAWPGLCPKELKWVHASPCLNSSAADGAAWFGWKLGRYTLVTLTFNSASAFRIVALYRFLSLFIHSPPRSAIARCVSWTAVGDSARHIFSQSVIERSQTDLHCSAWHYLAARNWRASLPLSIRRRKPKQSSVGYMYVDQALWPFPPVAKVRCRIDHFNQYTDCCKEKNT